MLEILQSKKILKVLKYPTYNMTFFEVNLDTQAFKWAYKAQN